VVDFVIARYGELSIKGNNRSAFEKSLVENMQRVLTTWPETRVSRISGRVMVALRGAPAEQVMARLARVFGIQSLSPVYDAALSMDSMYTAAEAFVRDYIRRHPTLRTFKVDVKRANKRFPLRTPEIASEIGGQLLAHFQQLTVDVHHPELVVWIEVRDEQAFVYGDHVPAVGGLPVGTSGKVGLLLSGGIDSPVAGWLSLKRGVTLEAIHFQSFPFTSERALQKVETLASQLAQWGHGITLHNVHFTETQLAIRKTCPNFMQTIVMRRMMLRIAAAIAHERDLLALVTGDSLGQVASQTLESIHVVNAVTNLPVLRPLIGEDKVDIIHRARRIGTYETSILPYEDCCTVFAPKSPRTRPTIAEAEIAEQGLEIDTLVRDALEMRQMTVFA